MAHARKDGRRLIQEATLQLMDEMPFHRIKVSDICRRAGINRSSYYGHYYEQTEVVAGVSRRLVRGIVNEFDSVDQTPDDGARAVLESCRYIRERSEPFRTIMASEVSSIMRDSFYECFSGAFRTWSAPFVPDGVPLGPFVSYHFSGFYGTLEQWVLGSCAEPAEDIASTIMHIMVRNARGDA